MNHDRRTLELTDDELAVVREAVHRYEDEVWGVRDRLGSGADSAALTRTLDLIPIVLRKIRRCALDPAG